MREGLRAYGGDGRVTTAVLSHPRSRPPSGIASSRSIQVGQRFGPYEFEANAFDIDNRPYVKAADEEWSYQNGVVGTEPNGHYLYVWPSEWGTVTVCDQSGARHELAPGWYAWPDENEPVQGALL